MWENPGIRQHYRYTLCVLSANIIARPVYRMPAGSRGIQPLRVYAGSLMTSLDSAGIQISLLRLADHYESSLIGCLDDKTDAPCWPGSVYSVPPSPGGIRPRSELGCGGDEKRRIARVGPALNEAAENVLRACLENACSSIKDNENKINELDSECGDGDCGTTLRRLAEGRVQARSIISITEISNMWSIINEHCES